jgi:hypothetical protein
MPAPSITLAQILKLDPCKDRYDAAKSKLPASQLRLLRPVRLASRSVTSCGFCRRCPEPTKMSNGA